MKMVRFSVVVVVGEVVVVDLAVVVGVNDEVVFIDVPYPVAHARSKKIAMPLPSAVAHAITDAAVAQRYYNRCCSSCGSVGSYCCY